MNCHYTRRDLPEKTLEKDGNLKRKSVKEVTNYFNVNFNHKTSSYNEIFEINSKTPGTLVSTMGCIVSLIKDLYVNTNLKF